MASHTKTHPVTTVDSGVHLGWYVYATEILHKFEQKIWQNFNTVFWQPTSRSSIIKAKSVVSGTVITLT